MRVLLLTFFAIFTKSLQYSPVRFRLTTTCTKEAIRKHKKGVFPPKIDEFFTKVWTFVNLYDIIRWLYYKVIIGGFTNHEKEIDYG